ncbi:DUF3370 domain-containing protein [Crocosphaera watsonii]|uniref:DUF3370 domain-containing protein n=3 Tax=Crocosphaera watsonii TaxID=263511 RepID=T2JYN4_CROWT|nr:DUF3370 domain-containing protein [Crocosphaera watsonii]EHJ10301.1 hypothetical protein CWATWH0003_4956 [Crocosphaera watsonii WH 0003]CCQ58614.1 hypothetical protein CWATWH0005_1113 [Crocosphaera watsonii WH 0005]CCQ70863.1 hypothetical protein CWATWH0402_3918 [Crocosphaera watsonii WH 0402]
MIFLPLLLANNTTIDNAPPQEIVQPQEVRPLPGKLNSTPVFNSNSPELVKNEGVLLSTFPPLGKQNPNAHLNYLFRGRFDVFAHHVASPPTPEDLRTLYLGIILHNPTTTPVTIRILQGASHLSQPDAPFVKLPPQVEDPLGRVYAGPGSRVMGDILRGIRQDIFPPKLVIPPKESRMLLNLPIPVKELSPPLNGRSTYVRLESNGGIYGASLAKYAPIDEVTGVERPPTRTEWEKLLKEGELVTPRDRPPSPPNASNLIYGRVAGVSQGSVWNTRITDETGYLTIPAVGESISYGLSTLSGGTFGTNQVQTAPMLVRYPDTAYEAHGNYGVQYSLTLPLYNPTGQPQTVTVRLQTPLKQDTLTDGLRFLSPVSSSVFFRGPIQVRYIDEEATWQNRYFHLVQHRGQMGEPLVSQTIPPKRWRLVSLDFLYPPDATPPQVLTIQTDE